MNENPGDTPNPLNPNPNENPVSESGSIPVNKVESSETVSTTIVEPASPMEPEPVITETITEASVPTEPAAPADPLSRPMEKAPTPEVKPAKNKKTGLIVGGIICLFVAICCGVAAILLFLTSKNDPVSAAFNKLISDQRPAYITLKGDISLSTNDTNSIFSKLNVNLDSTMMTNSFINSTNANITATMQGGNDEVSFSVNEAYPANGDLYLQIEGISKAIEEINAYQNIINGNNTEEECITDEFGDGTCISEPNNDILTPMLAILGPIDGQWMRISEDELKAVSGAADQQNILSCVINTVNGINNNKNSLAKYYQDNPFIVSTNEDVTITSKQFPVYQVNIDEEKFTSFAESINGSDFIKQLASCTGNEDTKLDTSKVLESVRKLPKVYVEVDNNNNFTRIYFTSTSEEGETSISVDLDISYPANVNVPEPTEYKDFKTIIESLFSSPTTVQY